MNYLAPFLLTRLLLPLIRRSTPARIINVSSVGQVPIDFDDVMLERKYEPLDAYRQAKLAQIMDTFDLAGELEGGGVTVNCLDPDSLMQMATSPELDELTGQYYDQRAKSRANPLANDPVARAKLKQLSLRLAGLPCLALRFRPGFGLPSPLAPPLSDETGQFRQLSFSCHIE